MLDVSSRIEHRWGERLHVEFPILITARTGAGVVGARVFGTVVDVSLSGARIRAGLIPRRQALIELSFELPTAHGKRRQTHGSRHQTQRRRAGDRVGRIRSTGHPPLDEDAGGVDAMHASTAA